MDCRGIWLLNGNSFVWIDLLFRWIFTFIEKVFVRDEKDNVALGVFIFLASWSGNEILFEYYWILLLM